MVLACRADSHLHILAEGRQEFLQPSNRKTSGTIAHEQRHVWLPDAEKFRGLHLRQPSITDNSIDLKRQMRLHQFLLRIRQAEVSEDVTAAFGDGSGAQRRIGPFPASSHGCSHSILPLFMVPLRVCEALADQIQVRLRCRNARFGLYIVPRLLILRHGKLGAAAPVLERSVVKLRLQAQVAGSEICDRRLLADVAVRHQFLARGAEFRL